MKLIDWSIFIAIAIGIGVLTFHVLAIKEWKAIDKRIQQSCREVCNHYKRPTL